MESGDKIAFSSVRNIRHLPALAERLGFDPAHLEEIARDSGRYWKPGRLLQKSNGEPRPTHDALEPLKSVHESINRALLKRVDYPPYLLAGIKDRKTPRDYARHAALHAGTNILISEDIANFFPSTTGRHIHSIWQGFFGFHPDIAALLTQLTTYKGCLPQGWKNSGYLANLVFYKTEPVLVTELERRGFVYSRFMDDVTVSCRGALTSKGKSYVVSQIYKLLFQRAYRPKREKHSVASRGGRMEVTGLNVNTSYPTLPKTRRNQTRAIVHACEQYSKSSRASAEYRDLFNRASGRVGEMKRFHPKQADAYRQRLNKVRPL